MAKSETRTCNNGATPFAQTYFHGSKADLKVNAMKAHLAALKDKGIESLN